MTTSFTGPVSTIRGATVAVLLHHLLDKIAVRSIRRKAERQSEPRTRAKSADEQLGAAAVAITFDVLEQ
jgi:hypothetical protein